LLVTELCPPPFGYSSKHMESLCGLLLRRLMINRYAARVLSLVMLLSKGSLLLSLSRPLCICLLSAYLAILNVQSSLCSKSLKPSVRSSRLSSLSLTSHRRPLGSAVVHSYYTPTRVVEYFEVVARALKYSHQTKTASERWILPMYIFLISRCSSTVYCSRLLFILI
jgi:hypothetical protein